MCQFCVSLSLTPREPLPSSTSWVSHRPLRGHEESEPQLLSSPATQPWTVPFISLVTQRPLPQTSQKHAWHIGCSCHHPPSPSYGPWSRCGRASDAGGRVQVHQDLPENELHPSAKLVFGHPACMVLTLPILERNLRTGLHCLLFHVELSLGDAWCVELWGPPYVHGGCYEKNSFFYYLNSS